MADVIRMSKTTVYLKERDFPFVVRVAIPDGGFECTLGAIKAWHHHHGSPERRGQRRLAGEQEFWRWCFDGLEIAKAVRQRFGGQILPVAMRLRTGRRPDGVSPTFAAGKSAHGRGQRAAEVKRASPLPA